MRRRQSWAGGLRWRGGRRDGPRGRALRTRPPTAARTASALAPVSRGGGTSWLIVCALRHLAGQGQRPALYMAGPRPSGKCLGPGLRRTLLISAQEVPYRKHIADRTEPRMEVEVRSGQSFWYFDLRLGTTFYKCRNHILRMPFASDT
ncbi:hypothetical protein CDAR_35011 [Caerostris darwini]|uniref:Uncharacterized protein n=1 Tax=Caerostris darwini TaxID=1538125 RepID=A0AAV4R3P4_9ARAC|nr:hypothetical protein CDAR_35011 [Caerostris darwini]